MGAERPELSVILPTLREAENLASIVPSIARALRGEGLSHEIIVVDDDSRDGTDRVIAELSRSLPVSLITRREPAPDLAQAVLAGFGAARGEVLACMDADGSHDPEILPELYRAIGSEGAQMALGSRFAPGGSLDPSFSGMRRVFALLGRLSSAPLTGVRDPMTGFFAVRRDVLEAACPMDARGFKIAIEILATMPRDAVREVPIRFSERLAGSSKLSPRVLSVYVRRLAVLYARRVGLAVGSRPSGLRGSGAPPGLTEARGATRRGSRP